MTVTPRAKIDIARQGKKYGNLQAMNQIRKEFEIEDLLNKRQQLKDTF